VRVLGVDGCARGWAVVGLDGGRVTHVHVAACLADVVDDPAVVIAVDTPMGEPRSGARGAEREARRLLRGRASTIFTPPPLAALDCETYDEARAVSLATTGKKISTQAWGLRRAMRDARPHWLAAPERLREAHPECSFARIAGAVVTTRKSTPAGQADRRALLASVGLDRAPHLDALAGRAVEVDLVDAAAIAWTADRIARGAADSLPDPPERDADGRPVAIWV
jgi:predicted RNase H-like nuclease